MDLQLEFQEFANDLNGRFVIIDMFSGIDMNNGYDLNNYQDMGGQYVIPKFRELCKKYNFTILLIHRLNKNNKSLGSTAIDGSVDGIFTLKLAQNLKNKILFTYKSRGFESIDLVLKRNENLIFEKSETDSNDLNPNLLIFLNYAIKQKEFSFTISDITSKLNLQIVPSVFGKLLKSNLYNLKKEGLHIEAKRKGTGNYYQERTIFNHSYVPLSKPTLQEQVYSKIRDNKIYYNDGKNTNLLNGAIVTSGKEFFQSLGMKFKESDRTYQVGKDKGKPILISDIKSANDIPKKVKDFLMIVITF